MEKELITEAIIALAAGSIAGVGKAIERGLGLLLPLVIGLFAKLIGSGGLSKQATKKRSHDVKHCRTIVP